MSLFAELKRRNVIRMAGLYLVGAWLVVQVAATVLPWFDVSSSVLRGLVVVLAIGFVPALVVSWVFELTPDGLRRDAEVPAEQSIAPRTARRMDRLIIVALVLALALFAFDRFVLSPQREAALVVATTQSVKAETGAGNPMASEKSIAVLPFVNMSADRDNEYFSDGIAEEILNALAQVKDLKVAGRTSSFQFKGKNENLTVIGEALGVAHVLEGSVRKQGDKVRIVAQLIRAKDGYHQWSETYDGDLSDVFALQERIAQAIAAKLQLTLSGAQAQRLVDVGTRDPDAYQLFLQATSIFNRRDRTRFGNAIEALQDAVRLDPQFARAYARLASLYVVLPSYTDADPKQSHEQVMRNAERALALDAQSAEAWAARGASLRKFKQLQLEGMDAFVQATRLDPNDVTTKFWYGLTLLTVGYRRQGTAVIDETLVLDPMLPNALRWRGMLYLQDGDYARAAPMLQRAYDLGLVNTANALSDVAMKRGETEAARRLWLEGSMGLDFGMTADELTAVHQGIYGDDAARREGVRAIEGVLARMGEKRGLPTLPLYLFRLNEPALGLETLQRDMGDRIDAMNWIWTKDGAPIRAQPGFGGFLRAYQLPAVWDKYGPPDMCTKSASGDYTCQ